MNAVGVDPLAAAVAEEHVVPIAATAAYQAQVHALQRAVAEEKGPVGEVGLDEPGFLHLLVFVRHAVTYRVLVLHDLAVASVPFH